MPSPLSGLREGLWELAKQKRERPQQELDQAVKYAQLAESGYQVGNQGGRMTLMRDPSFSSSVPEGFTRVSGKVVRDPSYLNPLQKKRMELAGGDSGLTAGQRLAKDKATADLFATAEMNNVKRSVYDNALKGAENIPKGFFGKARINTANAFPAVKGMLGVNDQMIQDSQELKMALTDATLANAALTKGAISDKEMAEFSRASANNDFNSPGIIPVLQKLKAFLDAEEAGKMGAYQKSYGEDPRTFLPKFGQGAQQPSVMQDQFQMPNRVARNMPTFASEQQAQASGYKGQAIIAGRKAVIE